jgi:hypothetical protein
MNVVPKSLKLVCLQINEIKGMIIYPKRLN